MPDTMPRPMLTDDPALPPVFRAAPDVDLSRPPVFTIAAGNGMLEQAVVHDLKTQREWFDAVWTGRKRAELRHDDRGFKVGHALWLREWSVADGFLGRCILARITHMLDSAEVDAIAPGPQPHGLVLLSIQLEGRYIR